MVFEANKITAICVQIFLSIEIGKHFFEDPCLTNLLCPPKLLAKADFKVSFLYSFLIISAILIVFDSYYLRQIFLQFHRFLYLYRYVNLLHFG